jgi:hypothetical protein
MVVTGMVQAWVAHFVKPSKMMYVQQVGLTSHESETAQKAQTT